MPWFVSSLTYALVPTRVALSAESLIVVVLSSTPAAGFCAADETSASIAMPAAMVFGVLVFGLALVPNAKHQIQNTKPLLHADGNHPPVRQTHDGGV
jgi:hypothetical protein